MKVGLKESLMALLKADFKSKTAIKQLAIVSCLCLITLLQETIGLYWLTNLGQPTVNYSNIEKTFEENHPPVLVFANSFTAAGTQTDALLERVKMIVDPAEHEENSDHGSGFLMLEQFDW